MKDLPFVNEMETDYNRLSPKYIFFAILEHEGKSDEDIQRIMGRRRRLLRRWLRRRREVIMICEKIIRLLQRSNAPFSVFYIRASFDVLYLYK